MFAGIMTGHSRARAAILLGMVCLLMSGLSAQSWQQYDLSSNASIVGGGYLGEPARTWQVYREQMAEIEIAVGLGNTGQNAVYFNTAIIGRALRVRMFSIDATGEVQERPVTVAVRGVLEKDGSGPFVTLPDQLVLTEGALVEERRSMVVWIVAVTQPDGRPFAPGRYRFETEMPDIRSAIVPASGERLPDGALKPWSGVTRGDLGLVVTAPSKPSEVALMYVQQGDVAFERRQFEGAVALFRQAVDANPSDAGTALQRLGGTYLKMGRYADALQVLQRLPIRGQGIIEAYLAEAYVGTGKEAEARDLLRGNGRPEAEVVAAIEGLRTRVRQPTNR